MTKLLGHTIRELSTPQLLAIRQIIVSGTDATAQSNSYKVEAQQLRKELAEAKTFGKRWDMLEDAGVEHVFDKKEDRDFILRFSDAHFDILLRDLIRIKEHAVDAALSEITGTMKVPPLSFSERESEFKSNYEIVAETLRARRNGGNN